MIKTIKESFFLSEDDTESSSDFPDQGGTCDQSEDSLSSDVREIAEISSSSESSSKSSFMSKLSLPNNTEDSLVASLELPTSAITEDPSDVNITPRRTTPPKIVVLNKKKYELHVMCTKFQFHDLVDSIISRQTPEIINELNCKSFK